MITLRMLPSRLWIASGTSPTSALAVHMFPPKNLEIETASLRYGQSMANHFNSILTSKSTIRVSSCIGAGMESECKQDDTHVNCEFWWILHLQMWSLNLQTRIQSLLWYLRTCGNWRVGVKQANLGPCGWVILSNMARFWHMRFFAMSIEVWLSSGLWPRGSTTVLQCEALALPTLEDPHASVYRSWQDRTTLALDGRKKEGLLGPIALGIDAIKKITVKVYLEPVCPLFWGLKPPKEGLFQSKQGALKGSRYQVIYWKKP